MKIRIAVAVAKDGSFNAQGYWNAESNESTDKCLEWAVDGVRDCVPGRIKDDEYHVVFVEADVPLPPSPTVVQGEVRE